MDVNRRFKLLRAPGFCGAYNLLRSPLNGLREEELEALPQDSPSLVLDYATQLIRRDFDSGIVVPLHRAATDLSSNPKVTGSAKTLRRAFQAGWGFRLN